MGLLSWLSGNQQSREGARLRRMTSIESIHKWLRSNRAPDNYNYFVTKEDLCDLVAAYDSSIRVSWEEGEGMFSKDCLWVRLQQEGHSEMIEFIGLCKFSDHSATLEEWMANFEIKAPSVWGIKGGYIHKFMGNSKSISDFVRMKLPETLVPASDVPEKIAERCKRIGL